MLSEEQKAIIPRSTRQRWVDILHDDYFGYEMVKDYIADFDHIKDVLTISISNKEFVLCVL